MEDYKGIIGKWEFRKKEKQLIDYCISRGYKITKCKQFVAKTIWEVEVEKDIIIGWETVDDTKSFNQKQFSEAVNVKVELESLKKQVNN